MTWAAEAWASAPYSAGSVTDTIPPDLVEIPPPIPGGTASWQYVSYVGAWPWASHSWAGGAPPVTYPGGGIILRPLPGQGVMEVTAWWPDTTTLQLIRVHPDGSRVPVRGGYPITIQTVTRANWATNPSARVGLNGYVQADGTPTLSQLTGEDITSGTALRATATAAGACGVTVPTELTAHPAGVTIGVQARFSALYSSAQIVISWTDGDGVNVGTTTASLTASQISASIDQWTRHIVLVTPPAGAVTPTIKFVVDGAEVDDTVDLSMWTHERGVTTGDYVDGSTVGGTWLGVTDLSASKIAPIQTVLDGECPLDVPVTYLLYTPTITGGHMASPPSLLESGWRTWITHPARPGQPVQVDLRRVPDLEHDVDQGVFVPLGGRRAIVVTGPERRAPTGTVAINAISRAERDALKTLFRDLLPVLVRTPDGYHMGELAYAWISLGTLTESREDRKAWIDAWLLTAPFVEVNAPSAA